MTNTEYRLFVGGNEVKLNSLTCQIHETNLHFSLISVVGDTPTSIYWKVTIQNK